MSELTTTLEPIQIDNDDELYYFLSHPFDWDLRRQTAVQMLADGYTNRETAETVGVDDRTLYRWQKHPEFTAEKHKLAYLSGITVKAERIIMIKQLVRQHLDEQGVLQSNKDVLDWLKLLRDETSDLEVAAFIAALLKSDG